MQSVMMDVARSTRGIVKVGYINCDEEGDFCGQQNVRSYPQLRRYPSGLTDAKKLAKHSIFQGNRWPDFIVQWAMHWLPNKVVDLSGADFTQKGIGATAAIAWLVTFSCPRYDPSGCILVACYPCL